jgi:hypothetical protein
MSGGFAGAASAGGHGLRETKDRGRMILARASLMAILCGILIAGLWPFSAPENEISWSADGHGIEFGHRGTGVSLGSFELGAGQDESAGSVEAWLEPQGRAAWKTILAFDSKQHPGRPFMLVRRSDTLVVERHNVDPQGICRTAQFAVGKVFEPGRRVHVTIVLAAHHTLVYINGVLAVDSHLMGESRRNLTGRLILANSPDIDNSWRGKVLALAVFPGQLSADQVDRDSRMWTGGGGLKNEADETPLALYRFDEGAGRVAHNAVDRATDLEFPERYFVLHPRFLASPLRPFRSGWPAAGYWQDVMVNIVGFIPLGFFLLNYISRARNIPYSWMLVILAGFLLSLTIESLQWFLPTRDSDMTDVISNTLGAALGAGIYRAPGVSRVWNRLSERLALAWPRGRSASIGQHGG